MNNTIRFQPIPNAAQSITLWYYPEPPAITTVSQTITLPPGAGEYMAVYLAIIFKEKAEEDTTVLSTRLNQLHMMLKNTFKDRDSGNPEYIRDVSSESFFNFYPGDNIF